MSNFFDTLTRHPETLKNAAGGALSDLGGMGRSVMDALGKNNMGGMLGAGAVGGLIGALLGEVGHEQQQKSHGKENGKIAHDGEALVGACVLRVVLEPPPVVLVLVGTQA